MKAYLCAALLALVGCNQSETSNLFDFSSNADLSKTGDMTVKTGDMRTDMTVPPDLTAPAVKNIEVTDDGFKESKVTVGVGTKVIWTWTGTEEHTIIAIKPSSLPIPIDLPTPSGKFCSGLPQLKAMDMTIDILNPNDKSCAGVLGLVKLNKIHEKNPHEYEFDKFTSDDVGETFPYVCAIHSSEKGEITVK